jgi:adenylylsulfate kinase-like enzyme
MVYLITGKKGAGKTEYARRLGKEIEEEGFSVCFLDGDDFRDITGNNDFSDAGRIKNLTEASIIAAEKEKLGNIVILSFIAPKREWRDQMRNRWEASRVIYIPGGTLWEGTSYEKPADYELDLRISDI